ncbi:hypothetical protein CHS0354_002947 [Potamilus streckersoni]|uniref:Uncharacterized protein n=1 Tax=Potamilus streckersoni TaxID=2493646 RepID=A0AAE0RS78_9BIVA|nr:hypothetical protein CHS0354_002947 [Potamilus streckersoni]
MAEDRDSQIKQLNCPICLETFISPKYLPCMHPFCEKCICKHASDLSEGVTKMTTISCPVCSRPIPAPTENENPQDWAAKLPNNSIVLSLSASKRADGDAPVYCEACLTLGEKHISVAFCVSCSEYLCQTCYNCHKTFKISRDHQITVHSKPEHIILNSTQDAMTRTLETIEEQKSDVLKSIKDWSSLVKERVNKLETTIIQELEQICKEGTIIISDQIVESKSAIAAIETSQTMLIESTKSDDAGKILVTLTKVSQQLLKYVQKYDRIENRSNEIVIEFHLKKNLEEFIQTLGSLGLLSRSTYRIAKMSPGCSFE